MGTFLWSKGGEALEEVRSAAVKAAEEAETGAKLHDVETGRSSGDKVHAEGLAMESVISGAFETNGAVQADSWDADHKTIKMDDLFSGMWMIEEERDSVSDSGSSLADVGGCRVPD
ncbi:hypothetical protein WJX74_005540 [Apatococcus lobatus]|uniref:Uncharacterized protein n=1 Tax=Apatococcus lobatus TaxID=904363 RepID=A0AAW1RXE8_9CHLO